MLAKLRPHVEQFRDKHGLTYAEALWIIRLIALDLWIELRGERDA